MLSTRGAAPEQLTQTRSSPDSVFMDLKQSIVPAIALSVSGMFFFQTSYFLLTLYVYQSPSPLLWWFAVTQLGIHIMLAVFLMLRHKDFVFIPSEEPLARINAANLLTMFRISSTATVLFLLVLAESVPAYPFIFLLAALAFLTDFLDGFVARAYKQMTRIGQYIDSVSDYAVLAAVSIALYYFHLLSTWFFVLIAIRLGIQFLGMAFLLLYRGSVETNPSIWGKISVFATMALYGFAFLQLMQPVRDFMLLVLPYLEIVAGILVGVSVGEKVWIFLIRLGKAREDAANEAAKQ